MFSFCRGRMERGDKEGMEGRRRMERGDMEGRRGTGQGDSTGYVCCAVSHLE